MRPVRPLSFSPRLIYKVNTIAMKAPTGLLIWKCNTPSIAKITSVRNKVRELCFQIAKPIKLR